MFRNADSPALHLKVDERRNEWDKRVEMMMEKGFTIPTIVRESGLTPGQVGYRIYKHFGGSTMAYRRGESPSALKALKRIDRVLKMCRRYRRDFGDKAVIRLRNSNGNGTGHRNGRRVKA